MLRGRMKYRRKRRPDEKPLNLAIAGRVDVLPSPPPPPCSPCCCIKHGSLTVPPLTNSTIRDKHSNSGTRGLHPFKVFGVCAAMDISLAQRSLPVHASTFGAASTLGSDHISFNPMSNAFSVMEPIMKALPNARHILMYRDVRKVASALSHTKCCIYWARFRLFCGASCGNCLCGVKSSGSFVLFNACPVASRTLHFLRCLYHTPFGFVVFPCCFSRYRGTTSSTQLVRFCCLQQGEYPVYSASRSLLCHPSPRTHTDSSTHPSTHPYQVIESFGSIFQEQPSTIGKVIKHSCCDSGLFT